MRDHQGEVPAQLSHITLPASLSSLRALHEKLVQFIEPLPIDSDIGYAIDLALNEAFINVVKHGVNYDASQNIVIEMRYDNNQLVLMLQDQGKPIPSELLNNKSALSHYPELLTPDSWPESGMGLMMMFNSVAEINYEVKVGVNYLSLIINTEIQA